MPELTGLDLSGASWVDITGFASSNDLDIELSGASNLQGDIEAGNIRFNLSGASRINLTGKGNDVNIDVSGSSNADLSDFPVENANVDASGASEVVVKLNGRLDANASGASNIYYLGDPALGTIEASGGGNVKPR
jgi:hypothetical protein